MMKKVVINFIGLYCALISPLIGPSCRFQPTCSEYAIEAVRIHGVCKGLWLAFKRIGRCHPMTKGNVYDPVPKANNNLKNRKSVYR